MMCWCTMQPIWIILYIIHNPAHISPLLFMWKSKSLLSSNANLNWDPFHQQCIIYIQCHNFLVTSLYQTFVAMWFLGADSGPRIHTCAKMLNKNSKFNQSETCILDKKNSVQYIGVGLKHIKKHSEIANLCRTWLEERETVSSGMTQSSQLLLMFISWKFQEYPSIRHSVMLLTNMNMKNRNINPVSKGSSGPSLKCSRLFLASQPT